MVISRNGKISVLADAIIQLSIWQQRTKNNQNKEHTQSAFTFSKIAIETLEQGVKYVQI